MYPRLDSSGFIWCGRLNTVSHIPGKLCINGATCLSPCALLLPHFLLVLPEFRTFPKCRLMIITGPMPMVYRAKENIALISLSDDTVQSSLFNSCAIFMTHIIKLSFVGLNSAPPMPIKWYDSRLWLYCSAH